MKQQKLKQKKWVVRECGSHKDLPNGCWCRIINTIDGESIINAGRIGKEDAEYFTELHNNSLNTRQPQSIGYHDVDEFYQDDEDQPQSLTDEQKENIIGKAVQCNLEPRVQPIRTPKNMSINKLIIYNSIHMLIQQGLAYDLIKRHMLTGVSDKTNRYRKGLELDEIYSENIQGQKMDIEAKELSRIFDLIGWR